MADDYCMIPEEPFKQADPVIQLYSIMELLKQYAGSAKDLTWPREETAELFGKQTGRQDQPSYGLQAESRWRVRSGT